ncbi:MAG: hypothetical protein WB341_00235 [Terracidiphilus sp.]
MCLIDVPVRQYSQLSKPGGNVSVIPVVTFGLAVVLAVVGAFFWKAKDVSKDELGALIGPLVPLNMFAATSLADAGPRRKKLDAGTLKILVKLVPLLMRVLLSIAFAVAGFLIIFSHGFSDQDKRWGYTTLGTVLGYWLKQ